MSGNIYPLMGRAGLPLLALSLVSNLAILISPLFMMQLLDRVIPSGNTATLVLLAGLAFTALALQAAVEACRDLALRRLSRWSEGEGTKLALSPNLPDQNQIITHVSGLSRFLAGPGALAALGAPWVPLFLFVLWVLHPAFVGLIAVMSLVLLAVSVTATALSRAAQAQTSHFSEQEAKALRSATELHARTGIAVLVHNMRLRFASFQRQRHNAIDESEGTEIAQQTVTSFLRSAGQISALALGAWLVTSDLMSAGGMIAGSIITSKTFMAIEAVISNFPAIRTARQDFLALSSVVLPQPNAPTPMDTLSGALRADGLIFPRGGGAAPRLDRVSFSLKSGECLAIVGRAGSGKSTLLKALSGIEPAPIGAVFLDESELRALSKEDLFRVVGYLPQRAELNTGTIAEAISCFDPDPDTAAIVEATKLAGVHGLISALPSGFETDLDLHPYLLSAGQAQRVALARALYTRPKYLFLDEPNALLDGEGERALGQTLLRLKSHGTTIVMVLHRSGVMALADKVLKLDQGRVTDFGDKAEVLARWGLGGRELDLPLLPTSHPDLEDWIASQFTREGDEALSHKAQILGADLLSIGCAEGAEEALRFGKFSFAFKDERTFELLMTLPSDPDLSAEMDAVKSKVLDTNSGSVALSIRETQMSRILQLAEQVAVQQEGDATLLRATVVGQEAALSPPNQDMTREAS
ncbi:MAG: ATP-binding cassette domain-containing protein [Pseudomonadota bacterium]